MLGPTPLRDGAFVAVDIETTGSRPGLGGIMEIGAARIEAGRITGRFESLAQPGEPVPAAIRSLTGIDDAMLRDAPPVADVMERFRTFSDGAVLIAHNHRFDMGFLDFEAERCWGSPFPRPVLDTLSLARRLHPELPRHSLHELAAFYGVPDAPAHRALPDALATAHIWLRMLSDLTERGFTTAAEVADFTGLASEGALARKLSLSTHLPDLPGIYLFRDGDGRVIHLARAHSLRQRARGHFYAPVGGRNPALRTTLIQYLPGLAPLDAILLESRLQQRYRRTLAPEPQPLRSAFYLHLSTQDLYPAIRVVRRPFRTGLLFGPIANENAAHTECDLLSARFGLRRCTRPPADCRSGNCTAGPAGRCDGTELARLPSHRYRLNVEAAVEALLGDDTSLREDLACLPASAPASRGVTAREALRAHDRMRAALQLAERAHRTPVLAIVEGGSASVSVHVVVTGWLFTTLRFSRDEAADGRFVEQLRRAVTVATRSAVRRRAMTPRRLTDMMLIDHHLRDHHPTVVPLERDVDASVRVLAAAIRRTMRLPRKRHGGASAD